MISCPARFSTAYSRSYRTSYSCFLQQDDIMVGPRSRFLSDKVCSNKPCCRLYLSVARPFGAAVYRNQCPGTAMDPVLLWLGRAGDVIRGQSLDLRNTSLEPSSMSPDFHFYRRMQQPPISTKTFSHGDSQSITLTLNFEIRCHRLCAVLRVLRVFSNGNQCM